jgi:uncharacterized protein YndB with AHSA1/START domain
VIAREMIYNTTLRMERTYEAPAQAVFDAWTSEEVIRRWWHAEHDWGTTKAEVDLRVGGAATIVRFTHSGRWDEESVRSHEGRWGKAFDNLERALEAALPGG